MWDAGNWDQQWSKGISQKMHAKMSQDNGCMQLSRAECMRRCILGQWLYAALEQNACKGASRDNGCMQLSRAECMQRCVLRRWLYAALKSKQSLLEQKDGEIQKWLHPLHSTKKGTNKLSDTVCTHRWFLQFYLTVWNNQLWYTES